MIITGVYLGRKERSYEVYLFDFQVFMNNNRYCEVLA